MKVRQPCSVSSADVHASKPILVTFGGRIVTLPDGSEAVVGGDTREAAPKTFSTSGYGFYFSGKVPLSVNGSKPEAQATVNLPLIHSKPPKA